MEMEHFRIEDAKQILEILEKQICNWFTQKYVLNPLDFFSLFIYLYKRGENRS